LSATQEKLAEAERLRLVSMEEAEQFKASEADALGRVSEVTAKLDNFQADVRKREAQAASGEKLLPELRREVERLRAEVQRHEVRNEAAQGADASAGSAVDTTEVEALRAAIHQHEASASAASARIADLNAEVERFRSLGTSQASRASPAMLGKALENDSASEGELKSSCGECQPTPKTGNHSQDRSYDSADGKNDFELRILELEAQNNGLTRQLNSRPIVFQFGPSVDDVEGEAVLDDDDENQDVEVPTTESAGVPSARTYAYVGAIWCRRKTARGLSQCRKFSLTQRLERSLRAFTRSLLQRPLLLWLFYVHVFALWVIEFWRQAVSQPLATDPSARINHFMETAAKTNDGR